MSDPMDSVVLKMQRDSLRDALRKVLDTRDVEAKTYTSWGVAHHNFSDSGSERKAHERAMQAACEAEREARVLLLTLRDCGEAGHSDGKCGNASCLRGA